MSGKDDTRDLSSMKMTSLFDAVKESMILFDFYLHPSADPGQIICYVLLNKNNYERWSKVMRKAFKAKNKLGFIDGVVKKPHNGSDEWKLLWGMINSMLVAWILNIIEEKIRGMISCTEMAFQLWEGVRERFSVGNEPRIYELHAAVVSLKQENQSVQDYFEKLKLMWDDLMEYEQITECCCENLECKVNKDQVTKRERIQRNEFLFGLDNARFGTIRSNIICMVPPPSLNTAFSMVIQEERHQRVAAVHVARPDAVGFSIRGPSKASSTTRPRSAVTCDYCGRIGHLIKDCYQLHGFPKSRVDGTNNNHGRGNSSNSSTRGRGGGWNDGSHRGGRGGREYANNVGFTNGDFSGTQHVISNEDGHGLTLNKE